MRGYLLKHAMDDELFRALETVLKAVATSASDRPPERGPGADLHRADSREREVLQLISDGLMTAVAEHLSISIHTATRHRANLMQKLDAHNQVELLRKASKLGLILLPRQIGDDAPPT